MEEHHVPSSKQPSFDLSRLTVGQGKEDGDELQIRNNAEYLIAQIVSFCGCRTLTEKKNLAKRIAIWANTTKADTSDLDALLKKRKDPSVRNYGGLVNYLIKIKNKT